MRDQTPNQITSRLVTVKNLVQMPQYKDAFSESSIRSLIFNSVSRKSSKGTIQSNGMKEAGVVFKLGRRVLIDIDAFDTWITIRTNTKSQNIAEQLKQLERKP